MASPAPSKPFPQRPTRGLFGRSIPGHPSRSVPFLRRRRSTMSAAPPPPSDPKRIIDDEPASMPAVPSPHMDRPETVPEPRSPARQLLRRGRTRLRSRHRSNVQADQRDEQIPATAASPPLSGCRRRGSDATRARSLLQRKAAAAAASPARDEASAGSTTARAPRPSHHRPHNAGFVNPWTSSGRDTLSSALRARASGAGSRTFFKVSGRDRPFSEEMVAAMLLLADKPDFASIDRSIAKDPRALVSVWLGHCTFLLRAKGITVLTDPVWGARLGPLGAKRVVQPVCAVDELPAVDVCILSSANPDHFDKVAVGHLATRVGHWLVPLGLRSLLVAAGVPAERIVESDWWQETELKGTRFVCTPAQHHSVREDALWCSWVVLAPSHRFFYCGGTGYRALDKSGDDRESFEHRQTHGGPACPVFRQIADKFGRFDTALLPLGNYKPRGVMAAVQGDPVDMLFVHKDICARRSIAHRWGTFAAPGESLLDPVRALEAAIITSPVPEHEFVYSKHGKATIT